VWADDYAGDDIAQHDRLLEAMKHHRDQTGHNHDYRQILQEGYGVHLSRRP